MKDLPYFKWYPADAESDEAYSLMTNAEVGFYHRCLNRSWINDGLPAEIGQLARLLGQGVAATQKLWRVVGHRFHLDNGRYRNPRQEEERIKARSKSERASESVRTRYGKVTNVGTNDAPRALTRADSDSDSSDSSVESETSESRARVNIRRPAIDENWGRFVDVALQEHVTGSEDDWNEALKVWPTLGIERQMEAVSGLRRDFIGKENCLPVNYLRKKMWQRPERASSTSNGKESAALRIMREREAEIAESKSES